MGGTEGGGPTLRLRARACSGEGASPGAIPFCGGGRLAPRPGLPLPIYGGEEAEERTVPGFRLPQAAESGGPD